MRWLKHGYLGLVYLLLYLPIAVLVVFSFNASRNPYRWQGLSLEWYARLWDNDALIQAAANSLLLATTAATLSTLIGTLTAIALHRYRFRGKRLLNGMLFVVMMSPDIVLAISLLVLFILLGVKLGYLSLLLAHVTFCLPFVVVTVYARLSGFNAQIIEAARDLGASEWQMLRTVLVPIIFPAVMAGWLLGFTLSLDDVVVSIFVTGPTFEVLPLRIYSMVRLGVKPEVNALATVLLMLSLLALLASQYFLARK
ncbi:MAG: spermidine/putrescine ABC transporter permease PotC [Gammaproteobacteria bacterium]|jgi:spermidine/putrescine transport system permease protein|nr:MAG: spermidine/putrescine ABC transporter permease PotC [Gammaproteobacteria bacterium]